MQFGILVAILFFGSVLGVPPSVSKVYRYDDYEYNKWTDAFYKLHLVKTYYIMAQDICKMEGAQLMVLSSREDTNMVQRMMISESHFEDINVAWVGLSTLDLADAQSMQRRYELKWKNWAACNLINRKGEVRKDFCDRKQPFICKVKAEDAVYDEQCGVYGTGYKYFESVHSCYKVSEVAYPWARAMTECLKQGAHLVILNSEEEHLVIKEFLKTAPKLGTAYTSHFYYAGIKAVHRTYHDNSSVVFRTTVNDMSQTLEEAGYSGWSDGEPNNYGGEEFCGTIFSGDGKYNDVNCLIDYGFICEKEAAP